MILRGGSFMKFLRIALCLLLGLCAGQVFAAPGLATIQKKVSAAGRLWDSDKNGAQAMLRESFADAISWTGNDYLDRIREQGFYTAITCFSPELIDEVAVAADTYIHLFPKGRYLKNVYLYRAMAAWAVKDFAGAEKFLAGAVKLGKLTHEQQTQILAAHLNSGKHRTAERFIEGQRISRPSTKLTRDLKRFHSGNRLVEGLLKRVANGEVSGMKAVEILDGAIDHAWFAKKAPEASLMSLRIRDEQGPAYNSTVTEWCGLTRVVKHSAAPQLRLLKIKNFLDEFPEASSEVRFQVLTDLHYLHLYEFKDSEAAANAYEQLKNITALADRAEFEISVSTLTPESLQTEEGNATLVKLLKHEHLFPYDNGHLPVVTREYLKFMLAISNMALGRTGRIERIAFNGWRNLPVIMLYHMATGKKDESYKIFKSIEKNLAPQEVKMLEDLMMPLYMPVQPKDRLFIAGLAAVESFPDLGTDLLIDAISGRPRMRNAQHGLAVLSDVYNRHMAFAEAQSVWKLLAQLYPDSVWLK